MRYIHTFKQNQQDATLHNDIHVSGCFTTLGHNCRRWFPRSLWWKS